MRKKLFAIFIVVLLFGVAITGIITYNFTKENIIRITQNNLKNECKLIESSFKTYNGEYNSYAINIGSIIDKRVTIISENGLVLGESYSNLKYSENHSKRPEFIDALEYGEGYAIRYSETEGQNMVYYARRIDKNGLVFVLRLSVQINEIKNIQSNYIKLLLPATAIGLIICAAFGYFYINMITNPIRKLTRMATTISLGQYERRINITTNDEIGQLGHALNSMAKRLQETITDLSDKQGKLFSVLASMDDSVIVIDNNQKILIINDAAKKLFEVEGEFTGKHFSEVSKNKEIQKIINTIPDEYVEIKISLTVNKYLRIKATRVINCNENLGVMLFIQDITKIKTLEQMRSDFVANVSHELKSPLTSIKGFAETLKYVEDKPTRDKFLDIIYIESERLSRLINDILTLSELENKDSIFNFEKIDVNSSIEEICYIMEPVAKGKNISIKYQSETDKIFINGDRDKFKQMIINLVDNGIKYSNPGGQVLISTSIQGDRIRIVVSDSGIGIPKENIPRLFERFYRVDKGRSREMGGTGLGLAIVKHIVNLLNGNINVVSIVGQGTSFILDFPSAVVNS